MKKALSLLLIITIICSCFVPSFAANTATLSVSADKTSANVGDTITVYVKISDNSKLSAFIIALNYDTDYFQYVEGSATVGSQMIIVNGKMVSIPILDDSNKGKIDFAWAYADVLNSGGTVFTAKFKVTKIGGNFSIYLDVATDGNNNKVTSSIATKGLTIACAHGGAKWTETKAPTCTTKGEKKATCSTCGQALKETIPTVAHTYGEWVVITPATETEAGLKEHSCTACGAKETAEIPLVETTTTETTTQETTTQEQTEATTKAEDKDDNKKDKDGISPVIIGIIGFVVGVCVGCGVMFVVLGKKKKED